MTNPPPGATHYCGQSEMFYKVSPNGKEVWYWSWRQMWKLSALPFGALAHMTKVSK